jgi:hypothetical protein
LPITSATRFSICANTEVDENNSAKVTIIRAHIASTPIYPLTLAGYWERSQVILEQTPFIE